MLPNKCLCLPLDDQNKSCFSRDGIFVPKIAIFSGDDVQIHLLQHCGLTSLSTSDTTA